MAEVVEWSIDLVGHKFDLQDTPHWTAGAEATVVQDADVFSLRMSASLVGPHPNQARSYAYAWLEHMNGIGRLLNAGFRPLSLSSTTHGRDSEGKVISLGFAVEGAVLRLKGQVLVGTVNGASPPNPPRGAAVPFLQAAAASDRAHDALVILGRPNLTWAELYLVFELVEGDVGGKMFKYGWITKADADLFGRTANSYSTLRIGGRHGKDRGTPPPSPMTHSDALAHIGHLVREWLTHLVQHAGSGKE
jgi:hypothetical protein